MEKLQQYLPQSVSGRNILITGGTTGIGRAAALLLAGLGANVVIVGRTDKHLDDVLRDAKDEGISLRGVIADLSSKEGVDKAFEESDAAFGKLDVLINNAALAAGNTSDGDHQEWQEVVNTNLLAYISCAAEAVKRMKGNGHIINIGSMSADVREETGSVYVATKAGLQGFSEALRKQVNKDGIKVTLIEPGAVDTDMQEQSGPEKKKEVEALKMLTADDIAVSMLYCLSQPKRCDIVDLKIRPHLQLI